MRSIPGADIYRNQKIREMKRMEIGFVTGNTGKLKEISRGMKETGSTIVLEETPFIEIQADSLEEVIQFGMEVLIKQKGGERWWMKDDSGLFIDALDGFPGVYSAYVNRTIGNDGVLSLMKGEENRSASFRTVIGLHIPERGLSLFRGECKGSIAHEKSGKQGFGYDPIFIPEGIDTTFADMDVDQKNSMSHRIRALKKMIAFLETQ